MQGSLLNNPMPQVVEISLAGEKISNLGKVIVKIFLFILSLKVWLVIKIWDRKLLIKIDLGVALPKAREMQ